MAFIAAQGCMPSTVDDFWAMVWQEKAPAIVMMTKLMEKNKVRRGAACFAHERRTSARRTCRRARRHTAACTCKC